MGDLDDRLGRLHLGSHAQNGHETGAGGLGVPEQGVKKQRSQRFTVPTSPPSHPGPSLLPASSSTTSLSTSSLPYQAPPPLVQTQSIPPSLSFLAEPAAAPPKNQTTNFYSSREYSSSGSSSSDRDASPPPPPSTYPHTHPNQPYRPVSQADFLSPNAGAGGSGSFLLSALPNGGAGLMREAGSPAPPGLGQGVKMYNEEGEEIIETAIVIKSIPFAAQKEQLLAVMDSLHLPPPFAFNFHYDQGQFRGLAFANYRVPSEAAITVSALNGFEFMGRKLRAEFKRALKPGEKEAIERNKALKRMKSAQLLASSSTTMGLPGSGSVYPYGGGGGDALGPPQGGWNRREASAPGGYPGYGGAGVVPPVPQIPMQHQQQYVNAAYGVPPQYHQQQHDEEVDYGRPLLNGTFSGAFSAGPSPAPSSTLSSGARSFASSPAHGGLLPSALPLHAHSHSNLPAHPHTLAAPIPQALPPAMEFSYSSSPPSSDVGTSVSQRVAAGGSGSAVGTAETSFSEGEGGGEEVDGRSTGRGKDELDLNDPQTLEFYSRILLFRDDQLRDELAFARSLTTQQRRVVHLVAKKLGLEHGSTGEGEARRAVVWKKGASPVREEPRRLRQTVSSAAIRRAPSTGDLLSSSPARGYNSSSPFAPRPTSAYLTASPSSSSLANLAQQQSYHSNLRGKKSMPDIRYSRDGHILPGPASSTLFSMHGASASSASSSRSPSPVPPLPQSTSLSAHLAAYSSGSGYAPASSSTFGTPVAAQKRRSYASLRSAAVGGGGGWESPGGLGNGSNFATVAGIPQSFSSSSLTTTPTRGGGGASRPSVQNLFSGSESPVKEGREGRDLFWASSVERNTPGKAEPVRMPAGPGVGGVAGSVRENGTVGEELEWRKR